MGSTGTTMGLVEPTVKEGVFVVRDAWFGSTGFGVQGPATCPKQYVMVRSSGGGGYSGGPLVDADGRLVGSVATRFIRLFGAEDGPAAGGGGHPFACPIDRVLVEAARVHPPFRTQMADVPPTAEPADAAAVN